MARYFVRIRTTDLESLHLLQQIADLDIFGRTARQRDAEAFVVDGLLSEAQIERLRAAGYSVEIVADADEVARKRREEIGPL